MASKYPYADISLNGHPQRPQALHHDTSSSYSDMKSIEECLKARNVRAFELKAEDDVNKERLKFYRDAAGTCLTATVFIAALGASLMSFAHDSLSDLDQAHNLSDDHPRFDLAPTACSERDFAIAIAAFQASVLYSVIATMVVLKSSTSLHVGWWRAFWLDVRDRKQDGASLTGDPVKEEHVSALVSQLFSAKVLMYGALLFLLGGLISMSLCIFSDTSFGYQFLIGCAGAVFVFRGSLTMLFIIPYEKVKGLFTQHRH